MLAKKLTCVPTEVTDMQASGLMAPMQQHYCRGTYLCNTLW